MPPGAIITLFNGDGFNYQARIENAQKRQATVVVTAKSPGTAPSPCTIHLGQAISRGDRMDFAIQKATELGVAAITPLWSERCEVKIPTERLAKRLKHWQHIIISACEQSGRADLPKLNPPMPLPTWQALADTTALKLFCHPFAGVAPVSTPDSHAQVHLAIGPEGGFTQAEAHAAQESGYHFLDLGPRILRTETATILALGLIQAKWGDCQEGLL